MRRPVTATSAPDVIFRRLSEAIATGELKPGEKLAVEMELASTMGVAPMTLRVALAALREAGLIRTARGRNGGNFVSHDVALHLMEQAQKITLTRAEIRDLTDWRRAISGEACYLAAERGTLDEFNQLQGASAGFDQALGNIPNMRMADVRIHTLIAEASRSHHIIQQESEIQLELNKVILSRSPIKAAEPFLARSHEGIITAITGRNGDLARQEMIAHAESTFNWGVGLASNPS